MRNIDPQRPRRTHLVEALTAALALVLALGVSTASGQPAAKKQVRPNIVVITTDDQTVESMRVMANVNTLLAAQGATFDASFASFPLCCPSRATLLTGQFSHNSGVVGNNLANGLGNLNEARALPVWLQRAGYATAFVGKYLNGYGVRDPRKIPPGWKEWYAGVTMGFFDHTMNRNGKLYRYGSAPAAYQSDVYTRTAVDVVKRRAKSQQPFFLWLSYFAPHHGSPVEPDDLQLKTPVAAPRHRGRFAAEAMPVTPAFGEADVSDKPAVVRRRAPLTQETIDALTWSYRQRLESLLAVDEGIAELVAELRRAGELERTLIVFTSDNGFLQGEHRIANAKEFVYEPSVRVPLVFRGPGVPHGMRYAQPVTNADLAPTIVDYAQARPLLPQDGLSLRPLFADPGLEWGRDVLLERGPGTGPVGTRLYTAIRTPRFKWVEHLTGERELYDLAADPYELQSLHADPAYASVATELSRRLAQLRDCRGFACNAGPALRIEAPDAGGCVRSLRVTGADEPFVAYVQYVVNNRSAGLVDDAPFEHALTPGAGDVKVRALAVLDDGRRLTLDLAARACSS